MAQPSRDRAEADPVDEARAPSPRQALQPLQALNTLDLGDADLVGLVCDINDPDCVPGMPVPPATATGDAGPR